jgi:hypothetical protein
MRERCTRCSAIRLIGNTRARHFLHYVITKFSCTTRPRHVEFSLGLKLRGIIIYVLSTLQRLLPEVRFPCRT